MENIFKEPYKQYIDAAISELNALSFKDEFNIEIQDWYVHVSLQINATRKLSENEESDIQAILKAWQQAGLISRSSGRVSFKYIYNFDFSKMLVEIRNKGLYNLV